MSETILERKCSKCGTVIKSMYPTQLESNFRSHYNSPRCKRLQAEREKSG